VKKRIFAMLLAVAMLCTLMAACGGGDSSSGSTGGDSSSTGTSTPTSGDDTSTGGDSLLQEGLPLVANKGDYSFSIFCDDSSADNDFVMLPILEEQTNVTVDLRIMDNASATTRLNLDLNANEYADVIGGWILNESMIIKYGIDQGVFIPLEDIFEQYCPRISELLELPGVRERMTASDGHVYCIPYVCGDTTVGYTPYISEEWLKNVGMDMPTTTDEFAEVLRAFKEQDANGNGDPNDEIPFATDPNNKHLEAMTGYFGLPMDKDGTGILDGKVVFAALSPQYREFLKWFSGLYKEGLIDPEISTQDTSVWEGKGNRGLIGCSIAYGSNEFSGEQLTTPEDRYTYAPLPVLNADNGGIWLRDTTGFSVYNTQAVITDKAEHPEIIARWFDNAFELENGIGCNMGPVGVVVMKEGEGNEDKDYHKYSATELGFTEEQEEEYSWGNLWPQSLPKYLPKDFEPVENNKLYNEKKYIQEFYEPYLTAEPLPKLKLSEEDAELYSEYATQIQNYFTQSQAQFISGELDANDDAAWQSYVEGFKAQNLEEFCRIRGVEEIIE